MIGEPNHRKCEVCGELATHLEVSSELLKPRALCFAHWQAQKVPLEAEDDSEIYVLTLNRAKDLAAVKAFRRDGWRVVAATYRFVFLEK